MRDIFSSSLKLTHVLPNGVSEYFQQFGKFGKLGGDARAKKLTAAQRKKIAKKAGQAAAEAMTPKEREERARKAARARWSKQKDE